jgi:hypothetical protein
MTGLALGVIETIFVGAKSVSFLSHLGKDLVIKTLTTTTGSIISIIGYVTSTDKPYFNDIKYEFQKLDLQNTLSVVEKIIDEQNSSSDMKDSVKAAILGVNDILQDIHNELIVIKDAMDNHEKKYLQYWRSFNCSCNIDTIKEHDNILYKRYELLKDTLIIDMNTRENNNKKINKNNNFLDIC